MATVNSILLSQRQLWQVIQQIGSKIIKLWKGKVSGIIPTGNFLIWFMNMEINLCKYHTYTGLRSNNIEYIYLQ